MSQPDPALAEVWAAMLDVYAGALSGDRPRVDAHLAPDCTFWDSHAMPLISGLVELQAVRDERPTPEPGGPEESFEAVQSGFRRWGDTALLLHVFRWLGGDGTVRFTARNSSVWRHDGSRWLMAHNHEDVTADGWWPT